MKQPAVSAERGKNLPINNIANNSSLSTMSVVCMENKPSGDTPLRWSRFEISLADQYSDLLSDPDFLEILYIRKPT